MSTWNRLRRLGDRRVFARLGALCLLATGCARSGSRIEITSYKDPCFPEEYRVEFAECTYRLDASGDYHIVARAAHQPDREDAAPITQLLYMHLFWRPQPGRTYANKSMNDATLHYAIISGTGVTVYAGTGFVYPKRSKFGAKLVAQIENARLHVESQVGDPPELLGDARLTGKLVATENPSRTLEMIRELELRRGERRSP